MPHFLAEWQRYSKIKGLRRIDEGARRERFCRPMHMRDAIQHSFQRSRYELKYLIDEPRARQVRDFIRSYLRRDPHSIPDMHYSYPIYTMYLDDPGLALYHATVQAQKNRFKL